MESGFVVEVQFAVLRVHLTLILWSFGWGTTKDSDLVRHDR